MKYEFKTLQWERYCGDWMSKPKNMPLPAKEDGWLQSFRSVFDDGVFVVYSRLNPNRTLFNPQPAKPCACGAVKS